MTHPLAHHEKHAHFHKKSHMIHHRASGTLFFLFCKAPLIEVLDCLKQLPDATWAA